MSWKNSIGKKLGLAFAFIIFLFSLKNFFTIYSLQQLLTFTETLYEQPFAVSMSALKVKADILRMHISTREAFRADDKKEREKKLKLIDEYEADALLNLQIISHKYPELRDKVEDTYQFFAEWKKSRNDTVTSLEKGENRKVYTAVKEDETRFLQKADDSLNEILSISESSAATLYSKAADKEKRMIQTAYFILFSIILTGIVIGLFFVKAITKPVKHLTDTARNISSGNLNIPVFISSSDEVGQLSKSFSIMTESLRSMIEAEKTRVSELKKINAQYIQSLQKLNTACQIAKIGFWELDLNTQTFNWTDEVFLIFESGPDFFPNFQNYTDFFIGKDSDKIKDAFELLIRRSRPFSLELKIQTAKGNIRDIQMRGESTQSIENRKHIHGVIQDITEKEQTKSELIKQENKYRQLADNIAAVLYIFSNTRGGIYYSNYAETVLGYSIQELNENPFLWNESISEEDRNKIGNLLKDLKKNQKFEIEYRIRTKSGEWKWLLDRSTSIKIQDNEILIEGIAMDITERKRMEESLRKNEEQFRSLSENSTDYIMRYDKDFKHIYANRACLKASGKTWDEFIGKTHRELGHPPELSEFWENKIRKVFETGEPQQEIFEWEGIDGNLVLDWRVIPEFEFGSSKVISVLGVSRDISDLKKTEKALRESESRFRNIVNASPVPIGMNDENLKITLINPAFTSAYGYTADDLQTIEDWWVNAYPDPEYRKLISQTWFNHLQKAEERGFFEPVEGLIRCKDGSFKTVLSTANTMPSGETVVINYDITDRVKASEALQNSEARARAMLSAVPDLVFRLNRDGIYLDYKADIKDLYAQSSPIIGARNRDITPPEFADLIDEKIRLALDTEKPITFEFQLEIPETGLHNYEARMAASGKDEVTAIVRDITSRKQIEEALKKSELLYRQLAESAPVGIYRTDENGNCIYVNERWCSIVGLSEMNALGTGWSDALHPDDKEKVIRQWKMLLDDLEPFHCEYRFIHNDHSIFWVTGTAAAERDPYGKVTGYIGTITDISNLKKIEESLWETKERLEAAASAGIIGIWDMDIVNEHLFWDSVMHKLYGIADAEWKPNYQNWINAVHPEDRNYVEKAAQSAMQGDQEYGPEFRIIRPDGSIRYIKSASKTIFDEHKKPIRMIGINYDLTEQKKVQQDLAEAFDKAEAANKAKSEFLATMSHEIRTPMNAILGFTELLEKNLTEQKHLNYLNAIQSGGRTLLKLINDILDLAKIESGKIILQPEKVNVNKFIEDIGSIFQQKIKEKNLGFSLIIDDLLPKYLAFDELRLRQIIFNLLGNAIKFTETGYIKLTVKSFSPSSDKDHLNLCISVEDTGIGIPKQETGKIFDSFYKFEPLGLNKFEGTGLGLSICRRLCEAMGGEISLASEEGKGSVFTIYIPDVEISAYEDALLKSEYEPAPDMSGIQGKILIADDIYSNRELVKESFRGTGISVLEARTGLEAVKYAKKYKPDLILMDLKMPLMDGFEACRIIKNNEELKSMPVIAMTASPLENESLDLFDGRMRKPVPLSVLYNTVKQYLFLRENSVLTEESEGLASEETENAEELLSILTLEFLPRLDAFYKRLPLKDLKKFSSDIMALGKHYKNILLITYGKTVFSGVEEFDMEKVRRVLWTLPDIIEHIKQSKKGDR